MLGCFLDVACVVQYERRAALNENKSLRAQKETRCTAWLLLGCLGLQLAQHTPVFWHCVVLTELQMLALKPVLLPCPGEDQQPRVLHAFVQSSRPYSGCVFHCARQVPGLNFTSAAMEMAMETARQRPAKNKYQLLSPFTMVTWRKYSLMHSMSLEEAVPEKVPIVTGKHSALL